MATVRLDNVTKRYRTGSAAVRDVTLDIHDGEFITIVGPSGCGKSTTLNLIAGLEEPTAGRIFIGDRDVTKVDPGQRDIAMVFQSYALYPHMTVAQNIAFPLKIAKLSRAEIDERVAQTADTLELSQLLTRLPRELSGGQRQRVALGRALVRRPKAFLFDEPLSNLDAGLRAQMRGELKKLHERLQGTFIYVTHDQAEAMTLSHRVVLMREGQIEQIAPPRELYDRPATRFAAEFFGQPKINLLKDGRAIRPEHVAIGQFPEGPGVLEGTVELVEPLGADTWVTLATNEGRITGRAEQEPKPGAQAQAKLAEAKIIKLQDRSA